MRERRAGDAAPSSSWAPGPGGADFRLGRGRFPRPTFTIDRAPCPTCGTEHIVFGVMGFAIPRSEEGSLKAMRRLCEDLAGAKPGRSLVLETEAVES